MNDPHREWHNKKLGHDGFPAIAKPDDEPGYGHGYMDGPPPPRYDEAIMYEGSESSSTGTSSSYPATTTRSFPPDHQHTPPFSYSPGPTNNPSTAHGIPRAVFPSHDPTNERPRDPPRDFFPPPGPPPGPLSANAPLRSSGEPFTRSPPQHLTYGSFPPAVLHAHSDDLVRGFPLEPPTCLGPSQSHPFITHDVNEDDWARFLHDVRTAGGLTPVDSVVAGMAPRAARRGVIGLVADMALREHVNSKKKSPVAEVIADWNHRFFHPRLMDVVLAQGSVAYTGPEDTLPPDMEWRSHNGHGGSSIRAYDDTYLDARYGARGRISRRWDGDRGVSSGRAGRRGLIGGVGGLCELAGVGVADRRERVDYSRDLRASAGEKWRLVVSYKPPLF